MTDTPLYRATAGSPKAQHLTLELPIGKIHVPRPIYECLVKAFNGGRLRRQDLLPAQWDEAVDLGIVTDDGTTVALTEGAKYGLQIRKHAGLLDV